MSMSTESRASVPKVSVCVVTYNQEQYIRQCLESVYAQDTPFEFEVIIGDDASTDGTSAIVQEFAEREALRTRVVTQSSNVGPVPNYLAVHDLARGDYVAHIDGDDLMAPGKLRLQAQFLDRHSDCVMVGHDVTIIDQTGCHVLSHSFAGRSIPEVTDINHLVEHGCFFAHSSKMYRRGAAGPVDHSAPIVDFYLHVHHAGVGKVGYIDHVLGSYRRNAASISKAGSPYFFEMLRGHLAGYDLALRLGVPEELVRRRVAEFSYVYAMHCLRQGEPGFFRNLIRIGDPQVPHVSSRHRVMAALAKIPGLAEAAVWMFDRAKAPLQRPSGARRLLPTDTAEEANESQRR
jgi:glycosyltransferase involved in cell wall biosynthesis